LVDARVCGGEASHPEAVDGVLHREVGGPPRGLEVDLDDDVVSLVNLAGVDPPGDGCPGHFDASEPDTDGSGGHQECGGAQHLEFAEPNPEDGQRDGDAKRRPPANGRHQPSILVPGTLTPVATPSTMSSGEMPRIWASGFMMSRWVRTGRSIALTSSGVT